MYAGRRIRVFSPLYTLPAYFTFVTCYRNIDFDQFFKFKKMKISLTIVTVLVLLFSSCASLTKSQVAAVNQFAQTSSNFSAFPSKIINGVHDLHIRHQLYAANAVPKGEDHVDQIKDVYDFKVKSTGLPEKMDITFRIIDKYAQSLLLLTGDKEITNLDSLSKTFGTGIDSLIKLYNARFPSDELPSGIGGAISALVSKGGEAYIRARQAEYIKEFVPRGDVLIGKMIDNLLDYLQNGIPTPFDTVSVLGLVKEERVFTKRDYLTFVKLVTPTIDNDRDYFQMLSDLDNIELLYRQTIQGAKDLRAAHAALLGVIKEKKTLRETIRELQDYYEAIKSLRATFSKISSN